MRALFHWSRFESAFFVRVIVTQADQPDGATETETSRLLLANYYRRFSHLILLVFTKQQQNVQSIAEPIDDRHLYGEAESRQCRAADFQR
jgi:hypothetical protein